MPAARCNYLVVYDNSPQVYSSSTLQTILNGDPPKNCTEEGRSILFVTYFPDEGEMSIYEVTDEEVEAEKAKIQEKEEAKRKKKEEADESS